MANPQVNDETAKRLLRQRNIFLSCTIISLTSIAFALPHQIMQFRQRQNLNEQLVSLQAQIVAVQLKITGLEKQIESAQQQIRNKLAQ